MRKLSRTLFLKALTGIGLALLALSLASPAVQALSDSEDGVDIFDLPSDTDFGLEATSKGSPQNHAIAGEAHDGVAKPVVKSMRSAGCQRAMGVVFTPGCPNPVVKDIQCLDGTQALEPLFSRTQAGDGSWGPWRMVSYYTCPQDGPLLAAISHEWSTLTPTPTTATIQPDSGWVYANMPTIAMADDASELHTATLLGAQVDIGATPQTFTWVWGDGEYTVTDDPGAPYPNQTLTHTYAHLEGDVTLALETTWSGQYRINGGTWTDFTDTITSNTPPITLEVRNPHSQLVACTTTGHCR